MRHLDTFSGIGGWAIAAEWMGWQTTAFVEKDKFCQKVLTKNFPGVPIYDDIFKFSGKPFRGTVDILTGSTPCQPFSQAGKREGSNDERHLFPEFLRVVEETKPRWIVIENVYGLLTIESGQVFEDYHTSLEGQGYAVQTICIPASAVNAPHRRDRLWIVAHSVRGREESFAGTDEGSSGVLRRHSKSDVSARQAEYVATDTQYKRRNNRKRSKAGRDNYRLRRSGITRTRETWRTSWQIPWIEVATRFCTLDDELSGGLARPKGWRVNALKAVGNSIVPTIAYEIFRAIEMAEMQDATNNNS